MNENPNLIGTIKLDRNLKVLQQHLPKPSYSRQENRKNIAQRNITSQQTVRNNEPVLLSERVKPKIVEEPNKKEGFIRKLGKGNSESTKHIPNKEPLLLKEKSADSKPNVPIDHLSNKHQLNPLKEIKEEKHISSPKHKELNIITSQKEVQHSPKRSLIEPQSAANKKPVPVKPVIGNYQNNPRYNKYLREYKSQEQGIKLPIIASQRRDVIASQKNERPIVASSQGERPSSNRLGNAGANIIKGNQQLAKVGTPNNALAEYYRRPPIIQKDKENMSNVGVTPLVKATSEKVMALYYSPAIGKNPPPKYIPHYPGNAIAAQQRVIQKPQYPGIRPSWWG
jgi:hypothetical protein